jgi:hypothetical protein
MKLSIINIRCGLGIVLLALALSPVAVLGQDDSTAAPAETKKVSKVKPVKNTFQSVWIIDNQTVMVPAKNTLEFDIMHRFGTVDKGYDDFWGLFAPSNIRFGMNYSPINNLNVGIGLTKSSMLVDFNAKYAILKQTKGRYPVSVSFYTNMGIDTRKKESAVIYDGSEIKHSSDRYSFFHQLLIARKITENFSVQVAPSVSHQNAVAGFYTKNDSTGTETYRSMKNDHFALSFAARYKLTTVTSVIFNYDQPITKHPENNPSPNLALGIEFNTSSHSFQMFVGNYSLLSPQRNNLFNHNSPFDYTDVSGTKVNGGKWLIGFNITRLWSY